MRGHFCMIFHVESVFNIRSVPKWLFLVLDPRILGFQIGYLGKLYIKMLRKTSRIDLDTKIGHFMQFLEVDPRPSSGT